MITLKIKIKEETSKEFEKLKATGILVEFSEERKNVSDNEIKISNKYKKLLQNENKIEFINESKYNRNEADELINEIKNKLGI